MKRIYNRIVRGIDRDEKWAIAVVMAMMTVVACAMGYLCGGNWRAW